MESKFFKKKIIFDNNKKNFVNIFPGLSNKNSDRQNLNVCLPLKLHDFCSIEWLIYTYKAVDKKVLETTELLDKRFIGILKEKEWIEERLLEISRDLLQSSFPKSNFMQNKSQKYKSNIHWEIIN